MSLWNVREGTLDQFTYFNSARHLDASKGTNDGMAFSMMEIPIFVIQPHRQEGQFDEPIQSLVKLSGNKKKNSAWDRQPTLSQ